MSRPTGRHAVADLLSHLPADAVVLEPGLLAEQARDLADGTPAGRPMALVRPRCTEHVSAALRVAHRHRVPVVPQGTLTGLAGGANAVEGSILVSLAAMDRITGIDRRDQVVVVQPGVVTARLAREVALHGLFYPPDPASADRCTIGGNIATNAGGMRCVKYGVTRDFVRALEVVLADGSVIRVGGPQVKGVAGYDLTGLFVGSEGTLGVVTEATLALLPAPGPTTGVAACFADRDDALATADDLMDLPDRPSTLEYLDATVIEAIRRFDPSAALPPAARALLIVQTDDARLGPQDLAEYRRIALAHRAVEVRTARDADELDALMAARRLLNPAMRAYRGASLNEDVAVSRSRLPHMLVELDRIAADHDVVVGTAGHLGDGNLHPVICFDPGDGAQRERAGRAHAAVLDLAVRLGGTITGEHGVGLEKLAGLDRELGESVRAVQRALKSALDPLGILNPGKKL
jgi:glycolate oxidase